MNKLKEKIASLFIPKNSPYCHYRFKKSRKYGYSAKHCIFFTYKKGREYCRLLKEELYIQDQVKDCGINEERGEE